LPDSQATDVKEYLPENCQKDYDRRMRNAYAMNNYAEAKEALQKIFRQLERINPSAARSLEEGLEETLTVHRLGVGAVLRRKLATINPIESCLSTVQRVARNVKRWHEGNQPLRWAATGLLEAGKKFRRIKGSSNSHLVCIPFEAGNCAARNKCAAYILTSCVENPWVSSSRDASVSSRLQSQVGIVRDESCRTPPANGSQLRCDDGKIYWGNSTRQGARGVFQDGIGKYGSYWKTAALYRQSLSYV